MAQSLTITDNYEGMVKYILLCFLLVGCSTGTIDIKSNPVGADVFVALEGEKPTRAGVTPLQLDKNFLSGKKGKYIQILVKKSGFQSESFLVPSLLVSSNVNLSANLEEVELPNQCIEGDPKSLNKALKSMARGVALSQFYIHKNDLYRAEISLLNLTNRFPNIAVLNDLLGNIYYLKQNYAKALEFYERSFKIDPSNPETKSIIQKIRGLTGQGSVQ